jgi:hypothetical protein
VLGLSFILICSVCRRPWLSGAEHWLAYHAGDDLEELADVVLYCPDCAASEFDGDSGGATGFRG